MKSNAKSALWGALCADAYALGAHWVYDADKIDAAELDWDGLNAPLMHYHAPKTAGDFTHYGDQMTWLLESIAKGSDFDVDAYARFWYDNMQHYDGYVDGVSRQLMEMIEREGDRKGTSGDLAGAATFAPLLYRYRENIRFLLESVERLSGLTHASDEVTRAALYFSEVAFHLVQGEPLEATLRNVAKEYCDRIQQYVQSGIDSRYRSTTETIEYFGKACGIGAFPGVIHIVMKYENDYRGAMEANVRAGGDSAARGLIVGTLLGAHLGIDALPNHWCDAVNTHTLINEQLDKIDACCERENRF